MAEAQKVAALLPKLSNEGGLCEKRFTDKAY
eukprot:CAMPEP_0195333990 /NCGR_PEP_ID=MMETSP0708-20121125/14476_1 /TAXON_ID=33640 /ORGANISM="Asterionellopsis glacialis, Strain CCMP134" /LENGTH=30 /DNA_ID= /DNA_START= /DNA_END= /DNA_ORIENTATION=